MSPPEVGKTLYSEEGAQVLQMDRGRSAILRFIGTCSPALVEWVFHGLKGFRTPVIVNARELTDVDAPFVQRLLDHAGRKLPIALVSPPAAMIEILEQLVALEKIPIFSGEEAILPNGSIPDSLAQEKMALQELDSRFKINPLWRRVDLEHTWLCALCGLEVEDVRFRPGTGPGPPRCATCGATCWGTAWPGAPA